MTDNLERLRELLAYDAHSRRYQAIPDFVRDRLGPVAGGYESEQLQWDAPRYAWIDAALPSTLRSSVELGSSLGYFSLRLAHEREFFVSGFEPVADYAEASNLFAALTALGERAQFRPRGIGIEDVAGLPAADCLITLNVLHHAGNVFDRDAVTARGGWHAYAGEFLTRATDRFEHMIFQTGNSVKGEAHFPSEAAIDTLVPLLENSGWRVVRLGVITDFADPEYQSFTASEIDRAPRIGCRRNPETGLVEYRTGGEVVAAFGYGTLQRPLFHCVRT